MRVPIQLAIREPIRRANPNRHPNPSRRASHHARRRRESAKGRQCSAYHCNDDKSEFAQHGNLLSRLALTGPMPESIIPVRASIALASGPMCRRCGSRYCLPETPKRSRGVCMTHVRIAATAILVFSSMAVTGFPALAAPAKCNAELRKCNSHCNLVYESSRANPPAATAARTISTSARRGRANAAHI